MYSQSEIDGCVEAGAISAATAQALRAHVESLTTTPVADEEQVRLITSFNDIFVTIAGVLLFVGLGAAAGKVGGPLLIAAGAWGLSEFFTLKRRMALPSIVFLIAFVGAVGAFGTAIGIDAFAGLLALGAAAAHYWRFRVPITVAAAVASGVFTITGVLTQIFGEDSDVALGILFLCGIATFVFAMWLDMQDRTRQTQKADIAFWLHGLAALLIIHPIFQLLDISGGDASSSASVVVLLIYLALSAVALIIDRRALMVSALAYVLTALVQLFSTTGTSEVNLAIAALIIGSALLSLSAFWTPLRSKLVAALPEPWQAKVPVA